MYSTYRSSYSPSTHYGSYQPASYSSFGTTYSSGTQAYGSYQPYYGGSTGYTSTFSSTPSYSTTYASGTPYQSCYPSQTVYSSGAATTYADPATTVITSAPSVPASVVVASAAIPVSDATFQEGETTIASLNLNNETVSQNNSANIIVISDDDEDVKEEKKPIVKAIPTNKDCIFCKIVDGSIPSYKVYANEDVYSFLDINPVSKGHTLVVPKGHFETVSDLPSDVAAAIGRTLPKIAHAVVTASGMEDHNIISNNGKKAGQEVAHVHFHIIPRSEHDKVKFKWPAGKLTSLEAAGLLQDMANKI